MLEAVFCAFDILLNATLSTLDLTADIALCFGVIDAAAAVFRTAFLPRFHAPPASPAAPETNDFPTFPTAKPVKTGPATTAATPAVTAAIPAPAFQNESSTPPVRFPPVVIPFTISCSFFFLALKSSSDSNQPFSILSTFSCALSLSVVPKIHLAILPTISISPLRNGPVYSTKNCNVLPTALISDFLCSSVPKKARAANNNLPQ